jgi:hypothetical protein
VSNITTGELKMEPKIEEWVGPVIICLSTSRLALLQDYFERMSQNLKGMSHGTRAWVGAKFFPPAMRYVGNLSYTASTSSDEVKKVLASFWNMAIDCYVQANLESEKQEALDGRLILQGLRGGSSFDTLKLKYVKHAQDD